MKPKDVIGAIKGWKDDKRNAIAGQVRAKYIGRWQERTEEITGKPCNSMEEIAWDDPYIHIEYLLCDPVYCLKLKDPKVQAEFLDQLSEEEKDLFFYRDEQGHSYSDLVSVSVMRSLRRLYTDNRKTPIREYKLIISFINMASDRIDGMVSTIVAAVIGMVMICSFALPLIADQIGLLSQDMADKYGDLLWMVPLFVVIGMILFLIRRFNSEGKA